MAIIKSKESRMSIQARIMGIALVVAVMMFYVGMSILGAWVTEQLRIAASAG